MEGQGCPQPIMVTASNSHPLLSGQTLATKRGQLLGISLLSGRGMEESSGLQAWLLWAPCLPRTLRLFLGQSRVIAVDKGEAAICLTQENAQR